MKNDLKQSDKEQEAINSFLHRSEAYHLATNYAIWYVVIALVMDKIIDRDKLIVPAVAIYAIFKLVEYFYKKKNSALSDNFGLIAYIISTVIGVVVAIWF